MAHALAYPMTEDIANLVAEAVQNGDEPVICTETTFGCTCENPIVFVLECDWFPTELVAGIANGRYSNTSSLSRKTGWLRSFGVIELFRAEKVEEAISILNKYGFKFDKAQLKIAAIYGKAE